jgi:kinesin family protein 18/19
MIILNQVTTAEKILELLTQGNARRKTESTDANATSSRSHAVLEIIVKRKQRNQYRSQILRGKLALVDLAGSERASETNNAGQKLRDGANINKSLLALANCINALGKQQKKGLAYVPYRNRFVTEKVYLNVKLQWFLGHSACSSSLMQLLF